MVVQVHGFDWTVYTDRIMPAFEQWFLQKEEEVLYQLFKGTRCAREETFLPAQLQRARIWPRARAFAETLPLGPYSRREYQKLCSAEHFTAVSDRYLYKHAPQLYQNPEPVRAIWGALIETYCLPWSREAQSVSQESGERVAEMSDDGYPISFASTAIEQSEVLALLSAAGLGELAHEMSEQADLPAEHLREGINNDEPATQPLTPERTPWPTGKIDLTYRSSEPDEINEEIEEEEIEEYTQPMPGGVLLGSHPNTLQLRGWLASVSPRALALFEYLACGRRMMPFGYEPSEPYGVFIGYLTSEETWRLGTSLRGIQDPAQADAEADYLRFRYQYPGAPESYRLIDEILPVYAADFHRAVDMAAAQGLGLLCSVE